MKEVMYSPLSDTVCVCNQRSAGGRLYGEGQDSLFREWSTGRIASCELLLLTMGDGAQRSYSDYDSMCAGMSPSSGSPLMTEKDLCYGVSR